MIPIMELQSLTLIVIIVMYYCSLVYSFECCAIVRYPIWDLEGNTILNFVFILKYSALLEFQATWTNIDTNI